MLLRPPRFTPTDTPFPYPSLFRSHPGGLTTGLALGTDVLDQPVALQRGDMGAHGIVRQPHRAGQGGNGVAGSAKRTEEHTSELQSLMRISYAVFCLNNKQNKNKIEHDRTNKM